MILKWEDIHEYDHDDYSMFREYAAWKYEIFNRLITVEEFGCKRIAEIGVRTGYSALMFLSVRPWMRYIGFDSCGIEWGGIGRTGTTWGEKLLREKYKFNCQFKWFDTQKKTDLDLHRQIDFFHVDGDHSAKGVYHDLDLAHASTRDWGWIMIDDIKHIATVEEGVLQWIKDNPDKHWPWRDHTELRFIDSFRGDYLIRVKHEQ